MRPRWTRWRRWWGLGFATSRPFGLLWWPLNRCRLRWTAIPFSSGATIDVARHTDQADLGGICIRSRRATRWLRAPCDLRMSYTIAISALQDIELLCVAQLHLGVGGHSIRVTFKALVHRPRWTEHGLRGHFYLHTVWLHYVQIKLLDTSYTFCFRNSAQHTLSLNPIPSRLLGGPLLYLGSTTLWSIWSPPHRELAYLFYDLRLAINNSQHWFLPEFIFDRASDRNVNGIKALRISYHMSSNR